MTNRYFILLFLTASTCLAQSQFMMEDCANGIDDDGDGLIDLNDPDCKCKGIKDTLFVPSSLIPNASFEDYTCCPSGMAQLYCSKFWIQASPATSDYYNTCGYKDDPFRGRPPQPLPAGNGYVGFLDLMQHPTRNATYKEYVGACLTSTMLPGKDYTLSFWIGFGIPGSSFGPRAITTLGIYGTSACGNLPFGGTNGWLCPTAYPNWFELTRVTASGTNKWVKVTVKIRPTRTVEAIVIGPNCTRADGQYYYFIDDLLLEESAKFDSIFLSVQGNPCIDSIQLASPPTNIARIKYQWYFNGVAILGATSQNYLIPKGQEGNYMLRASDGADCELSNSYNYKVDTLSTHISQQICDGEQFYIGKDSFSKEGVYRIVTQSAYGCDSIVHLDLKVNTSGVGYLEKEICENGYYEIKGVIYDSAGTYQIISNTIHGCDSISTLKLSVIKTINTVLDIGICKDENYIFGKDTLSVEGEYSYYYLSALNCDSILTINLKVYDKNMVNIDTAICQGQSIQAGNTSYDKTGVYDLNLKNKHGCDSLIALNLKVKPTYLIPFDTSFCEGNALIIGGNRYNKTGNYFLGLKTAEGCDSNFQIQLNVLPVHQPVFNHSICEGEVFNFAGSTYDKQGNYQIVKTNQFGCDSILNLNLKVDPVFNTYLDTAICDNHSIVIGTINYTKAGLYKQAYTSVNSCDSIIHINLFNRKSYQIGIDTALCQGYSLQIAGQHYDKAGLYNIGLKTTEGCDSAISLNLKINQNYADRLDTVICFNTQLVIDGKTYQDEIDFKLQYVSQKGCDSTVSVSIKKTIVPEIIINEKSVLCFGDQTGSIQMQVNGQFGPYRYNWNNGMTTQSINQLAAGNYKVSIFDNHNCRIDKDVVITTPEPIVFSLNKKDANCLNPNQGSIIIKALSGGTPPYKYILDGRTVTFQNLVEETKVGVHDIVLIDANGCQIKHQLIIEDAKRGDIDAQPDSLSVILGDSVWLETWIQNIDSIVSIEWSGPGNITCKSCLSTSVFINAFASHFKISITDHNGCVYEEFIYVKSKQNYYVPNAFTPNGDNINDHFNIFTDRSIDNIEVLHIFDRWGNQVYEAKNFPPNGIEGAWNGEIGSQKAMPGVYVYLFLFKDKAGFSHKASGDLTLMR